THNCPRLVAGDRATFCDFDSVAFVVLVGFIMCLVLVGAHDDLAKDGVLDATFDANDNGLVHLVAHDLANEGTLAFCGLGVSSYAHFTFLRSQSGWYVHARYRGGPYQFDWYWKAAEWHAAYAG